MPELKLSKKEAEEKEDKRQHEAKKKDFMEEEVLVEFYNLEEPGVPLKFSYGPTKKPKQYTLLHGGKYKLTRDVINHIESRQTPLWDYKPDGIGIMTKYLKGYKSRFQCRQVFE